MDVNSSKIQRLRRDEHEEENGDNQQTQPACRDRRNAHVDDCGPALNHTAQNFSRLSIRDCLQSEHMNIDSGELYNVSNFSRHLRISM